MHITVTCVQCSRQLRLPGETLGSAARCPLCQATFLTRALPNGNAEAIPLAQPPGKPAPAPKPKRPSTPNLSLDDDVPEAPLLRRPPNEDESPRPYKFADDDAPEAPRRPRRDEDDRDEPRRLSSPDAVPFAVLIEKDPQERLEGRFNAEVDSEGMRIWRGRGRTLEVPAAKSVEHLDGARISVPIEGRQVELTVIEPQGRSLALAEQIVEVLSGERDRVALPKPPRGLLPLLILVPIGIPLLAVIFGHSIGGIGGGIGWGILGIVVAGLCALFILATSWSGTTRAAWAGSGIVLGYLILGCGFLFDRPAVSTSGWTEFKPDEGGFTVKMPAGNPAGSFWKADEMRGLGIRTHMVRHPRADITFEAGVGEFKPERVAGMTTAQQRVSLGYNIMTNYLDQFKPPATPADPFPPANALRGSSDPPPKVQGSAVKEYEWQLGNGRYACVRLVAHGQRLLVLCVTSSSYLSRSSTEVRQFFDSAQIDTTDPGPRPVVKDKDKDKDKAGPIVPRPADDPLAPNGKTLASGSNFVWAGYSGDGETIAAITADRKVFCWSRAGTPRFPEYALAAPAGEDRPHASALSPDGRWLAVGYAAGTLEVIETRANGTRRTLSGRDANGAGIDRLAFLADGNTVLASYGGRDFKFWDMRRPGQAETLTPAVRAATGSLAVSPDGKHLAFSDLQRKVRIHNASTRQEEASGDDPRRAPRLLAFASDNRTLASADSTTLRTWDAADGTNKRTASIFHTASAIAFHPGGRLLAVGSNTGQVELYQADTLTLRGTVRDRNNVRGPSSTSLALSFDGDGRQMVLCSAVAVELWQVERQVTIRPEDRTPPVHAPPRPKLPKYHTQALARYENRDWEVDRAAVSRDGSRVLVQVKNGAHLLTYSGRTLEPEGRSIGFAQARTLAVAPDGKSAVSATRTGTMALYSEPGKMFSLLIPVGPRLPNVESTAYSGDGKVLISAHPGENFQTPQLVVWDPADRKETKRFQPASAPTAVALNGDGTLAAVGVSGDGDIRLYDTKKGTESDSLKSHSSSVTAVVYSADGKRLASGDSRGNLRLWTTSPAKMTYNIPEPHRGKVLAVAFSPDGRTMASAGEDRVVKLWDVERGTILTSFTHASAVAAVGFGPGGKTLVVVTAKGEINRYDLEQIPVMAKHLSFIPPKQPPANPLAAGKVEPHLCHVVDEKNGYLLAFTKDKRCLHYSYPALKLVGSCDVDAEVWNAFPDPGRGVVVAATAADSSLKERTRGRWWGKGPVKVFEVKALRAERENAGKVKATASALVDGHPSGLADEGRRLVCLHVEGDNLDQRKVVVNSYSSTTFKLSAQAEVEKTAFQAQPSPDGKTVYVLATKVNNQRIVQALDAAALKPAGRAELPGAGFEMAVTDEYVIVPRSGAGQDEIAFLDRSKDSLPAAMTWKRMAGAVRVEAQRGTAYVLISHPPNYSLAAHDLAPREASREPQPKAGFQPPDASKAEDYFRATPDGKYLIYHNGEVVRTGAEGKGDAGKEPATLAEVARIQTIRSAAFDVKGGQVFVANSVGTLKRYSYPDFKQSGAYGLERTVYGVYHDPAGKRLYQVKGAKSSFDSKGRVRADEPELIAYDVGGLKPNTNKTSGKSATLKAAERLKLSGSLGGAALSPDAKSFYYLDVRDNKLNRVELPAMKAAKTVDVAKGASAMCLTPDGKSIWTVSSEEQGKGRLQRFDAATLEAKADHALAATPQEVVATDSGQVCVSAIKSEGEHAVLIHESDRGVRLRFTADVGKEPAGMALSGDQRMLYLSPRAIGMHALQAVSLTAAKPAVKQLGQVRSVSSVRREMTVSPDGSFLILHPGGVVSRLLKE